MSGHCNSYFSPFENPENVQKTHDTGMCFIFFFLGQYLVLYVSF